MCRVLQVSQSGYYAWRERPESKGGRANRALCQCIQVIHAHSRRTYDVRRVHAALAEQHILCGKHRVVRLMRCTGLQGRGRARHRPRTTRAAAPNVLQRDFSADGPNQKWLADSTYIDTQEGFLYLAGVLDVFSRRVVGWAMADPMPQDLVEDALRLALAQRRPGRDLLQHAQQGRPSPSHQSQALRAKPQRLARVSGLACCDEKALMDSLGATLNTQLLSLAPYRTRQHATPAIFVPLQGGYTRRRRHSTLGYLSPEPFEHQFLP